MSMQPGEDPGPLPTHDNVEMRIVVRVPHDRRVVQDLIDTFNKHRQAQGNNLTYTINDFIDDDWKFDPQEPEITDGFDSSEFAFFLLNNRIEVDGFDDYVSEIEYDVY